MKGRIASVVKDLRFSVIREMGLRAANYSGVISLGIGEPDFDTPEEVWPVGRRPSRPGQRDLPPRLSTEAIPILSESVQSVGSSQTVTFLMDRWAFQF